VAKNLVLAGIKTLVVVDHNDLAEDDIYAQFLAPRSCIGQNRAVSSLERLQALNPRVNVSVDTYDIVTFINLQYM
jgi:ubiquitin-like 1-activating enzyme E1 A